MTRYSYTPEGWLATVTDGEGNVTKYTYDKTGNVLTADCGDHHEENSYNELGKLTTVTTNEGVTEYQYDERGYLISVTEPNGNTVSYTYDDHGNRTSMTYPDGKTAKYTYDSMNRLVSVKGTDGKKTTYTYDLLGQRISTDGEKEDTAYTNDEVGNLISQVTTGKYDVSLAYTYDLSGRMISESRTEDSTAVESSYIYDAIGQLTEFTRSDGIAESYTYDPAGNMLSKTAGGIKTNYTYNAANQLVGDGTYKYTYDKIGNLVEKTGNGGLVNYTYNAMNLLEKWTDGENTETYTYNAAGLLSTVNTNSSTTTLTWDILYGDGVVISAETDGKVTDYTYGLERISAATGKSRTEYVYDGRGSVIGEVTKAGLLSTAKVTTKSYTPFGEQIGETSSGFGWNGEYFNATTGQVYLRARFYEPEMNRFSQKDIVRGSVTSPQSLNRYDYCVNDPLNFIDPSGKVVTAAIGAVTGAAAAAKSVSAAATKASQASKPIQTTTRNVNPNNVVQATNQAKQDARRAADIANAVAPGSPAAQQATRAYYDTVQRSQAANATHSPALAQQAVNSSRTAVNYANAAVTTQRSSGTNYPTTSVPQVGGPVSQKYACDNAVSSSDAITWTDVDNAVENYFTDSNMYGGIIGGLSITFSALFKSVETSVSTALRPANIGAGLFAKQKAQELAEVAKMSTNASKAFNILALGAVAIDVGVGIYDNIVNSRSAEKIVHDAITDIVFTGGTIYASVEIGAAIGSICPGPGNVIGAAAGFTVGVLIYVFTDMIDFSDGQSVREYIKSAVN